MYIIFLLIILIIVVGASLHFKYVGYKNKMDYNSCINKCNGSKLILKNLSREKFKNYISKETCIKLCKNKIKCPNISNYIRKDKIPCWGCNL